MGILNVRAQGLGFGCSNRTIRDPATHLLVPKLPATKVIKNVLEVQGMEVRTLNPERQTELQNIQYPEALPFNYSPRKN